MAHETRSSPATPRLPADAVSSAMLGLRMMTIAAAAFAMSACGSGDGGNTTSEAGAGAAAAVQEQTPANLTEDSQNGFVPVAAPKPVASTAIPAAFLGRWGLVQQDCEAGRDDAKGLMTVSADRIDFYESRATVSAIRITGEDRLTADLAFTGEGQTWRRGTALTLVDEGRTLVREEQKPAGAFRYTKCPA